MSKYLDFFWWPLKVFADNVMLNRSSSVNSFSDSLCTEINYCEKWQYQNNIQLGKVSISDATYF